MPWEELFQATTVSFQIPFNPLLISHPTLYNIVADKKESLFILYFAFVRLKLEYASVAWKSITITD
jgi:hypothetical protein